MDDIKKDIINLKNQKPFKVQKKKWTMKL
jgi:hypothetical protein